MHDVLTIVYDTCILYDHVCTADALKPTLEAHACPCKLKLHAIIVCVGSRAWTLEHAARQPCPEQLLVIIKVCSTDLASPLAYQELRSPPTHLRRVC